MFEHFARYDWVLDVVEYQDATSLITSLAAEVIAPAERLAPSLPRASPSLDAGAY
jgi:hypothetical protein